MPVVVPPATLIDALEIRRTVAVVGSGVSLGAGLPSWNSLLLGVAAYADETQHQARTRIASAVDATASGQNLGAASVLKDVLRGEFQQAVARQITHQRRFELKDDVRKAALAGDCSQSLFETGPSKPRKAGPTPVHLLLAQLNFRAIVTTNYDLLLESAIPPNLQIDRFTWSQPNLASKVLNGHRFILKLHGDIQNLDDIILAREDYGKIAGQHPVRQCLENLFSENRVFWIGYGHNDPDLDLLLDDLHVQRGLPGGYAVAVRNELLEQRFKTRDIFPSWVDSHDQVLDYLRDLAQRSGCPVYFFVVLRIPWSEEPDAARRGRDLARNLSELLGEESAVRYWGAEKGSVRLTLESSAADLSDLRTRLHEGDRKLLACLDQAKVAIFDQVAVIARGGVPVRPTAAKGTFSSDAAPTTSGGQLLTVLPATASALADWTPHQPHARSRIGRNHRDIRVDVEGIAGIHVTLESVILNGGLTIAAPTPGYNNLEHSPATEAKKSGATFKGPEVLSLVTPHTVRFFMFTEAEETFDELRWHYFLSNAYALDKADVILGKSRGNEFLSLGTDWDAYVYTVQAPTDELRIDFELPHKSILEIMPVAQRSVARTPWALDWDHDPTELDRMSLTPTLVKEGKPVNRVQLVVPSPKLGYRYGFKYRLAELRRPLRSEMLNVLDNALDRCRRRLASRGSMFEMLGSVVNLGLEDILGEKAEDDAFWSGRLWSSQSGLLLPAFGQFPPELWTVNFRYGEGIAGHAFRIRGPAVFHRAGGDLPKKPTTPGAHLLYRKRSRDFNGTEHRWIIEIPILEGPKLPAVGVVGFADHENQHGRLTRKLGEIAASVARSGHGKCPERTQLNRLSETISNLFWYTLAGEYPEAKDVLDRHWDYSRRSRRR